MRWLHRSLLVLALLVTACGSESPLALENESEVQVDMPDIHRPLNPGESQ